MTGKPKKKKGLLTDPRGLRMPTAIERWSDLVLYIRAKYRYTQDGLAKKLGMQVLAVRRWERFGRYPKNLILLQPIHEMVKEIVNVDQLRGLMQGAYFKPPLPVKKLKSGD